MTGSRWQQVKGILGEALDIDPASRAAFLDTACAGDAALRSEVESFLRAHDNAPTMPEPITAPGIYEAFSGGSAIVGVEGRRIGRYEIRRVIGAGGMGVVYEAVQDKPRRPVALKVMKNGITSRQALRRFEYESQLLGRLRHPGIAQVYEAGTHNDPSAPAPVPFFAMEYVPGARTLSEYVEEFRLGTRARVELLAKVCDAVHHGHTKGVIHRDLKPANILVDPSGQPKVIDFGVARTTDSDLAATMQTSVGQLVGTLQYMSPEQCKGDAHDIDTRTDVYSLGVMLYELLCGRSPHELSRSSLVEAVKTIREETPKRLSTIDRTLRGDLETIAHKALEKDRDRRYSSAQELGEDLTRYLRDEPIRARPPTVRYQTRMFVRRNRGLVWGLAAAFVMLSAGLVGTSWTLRKVSIERAKVKIEAENASAVSSFLRQILTLPSPSVALGKQRTIEDTLDIATDKLSKAQLKPEVESQIRGTIGSVYRSLGKYDRAREQLDKALELARAALGPQHEQTLAAIAALAGNERDMGRLEQAERMLTDVLAQQERTLGPDAQATIDTLAEVAWTRYEKRQPEQAEPLFRRWLTDAQRALGVDSRTTIRARASLAMCLVDLGRLDEAGREIQRAVSDARRLMDPRDPITLFARHIQAYWLLQRGDQASRVEAAAIYREVVPAAKEILGPAHRSTLFWEANLASTLVTLKAWDEAEATYRSVLSSYSLALGEGHPNALYAYEGLGQALMEQDKLDEAEKVLLTGVGHARRLGTSGAGHVKVLATGLVRLYERKGDTAKRDEYAKIASGS